MLNENILVTRPSVPPLEEYIEEIKSIWDARHFTNTGPKHVKLEEELEAYLGVRNVSLFSSGHMALELAIQAFDLKGEIITTPFTFASTSQAIMRNGIKPVFCDINEKDYTIDVNQIEDYITDKTTAIIPVHVYGNVCDVKAIEDIANRYGLKVIYDAAHAFGEEIDGRKISTWGDASMVSFHATKIFNTVEGGALAFENDDLVNVFRSLKQFGMKIGTDEVPYVATNAKMSELHAAMGLCNLRHVDQYIEKRKCIVERYRNKLSNIPGIKLCEEQKGVKSTHSYFPVVFEHKVFGYNRDQIALRLSEHNIFARKYFYPLNSEFECYLQKYGSCEEKLPIANRISKNILVLPLYPDLLLEDVDRICDIILNPCD